MKFVNFFKISDNHEITDVLSSGGIREKKSESSWQPDQKRTVRE
jgi:hypothetical protein